MLLVKNNLKKKKIIDDDDNEYLNYLKFSHLQSSNKPKSFDIEISDASPEARVLRVKATQFPDIKNNFTQTIGTEDKGVDTGNDLNTIVGDYILHLGSKNFDRNEKMVQATAEILKGTKPKSPPSSSSSDGSEGFMSKTARRGFRLAEFALNASITGFNIAEATLGTAVDVADYLMSSPSNQNQPNDNQEVISVHSQSSRTSGEVSRSSGGSFLASSPPETINSSSSDVEIVPPVIEISSSSSSRQTPSSIPAPTSPQPSSPASSAKTTPRRKKSK